MNSISPFIDNARDVVFQAFNNGLSKTSQWADHMICWANQNTLLGVIATANVVFLSVMHVALNTIDQKMASRLDPLNFKHRTFKHIVFDGVLFGGAVFSFNYFLSKAMQYPLSRSVLAAITAAAIAGRVLLNQVRKYLASREKPDTAEKVEGKEKEEQTHSQSTDADKHEILVANQEKVFDAKDDEPQPQLPLNIIKDQKSQRDSSASGQITSRISTESQKREASLTGLSNLFEQREENSANKESQEGKPSVSSGGEEVESSNQSLPSENGSELSPECQEQVDIFVKSVQEREEKPASSRRSSKFNDRDDKVVTESGSGDKKEEVAAQHHQGELNPDTNQENPEPAKKEPDFGKTEAQKVANRVISTLHFPYDPSLVSSQLTLLKSKGPLKTQDENQGQSHVSTWPALPREPKSGMFSKTNWKLSASSSSTSYHHLGKLPGFLPMGNVNLDLQAGHSQETDQPQEADHS